MGVFRRLFGKGQRSASSDAAKPSEHKQHLMEFASSRVGVEAFVEPATTMNPMTILLVAKDGEWTRRPVPHMAAAQKFAKSASIPVYDVNQSGYPSAMREYNQRRKSTKD